MQALCGQQLTAFEPQVSLSISECPGVGVGVGMEGITAGGVMEEDSKCPGVKRPIAFGVMEKDSNCPGVKRPTALGVM